MNVSSDLSATEKSLSDNGDSLVLWHNRNPLWHNENHVTMFALILVFFENLTEVVRTL